MQMRKSECFFFYTNSDLDHSQNLTETNLDQDPSSDIYHGIPTSSICVIHTVKKIIPLCGGKNDSGLNNIG